MDYIVEPQKETENGIFIFQHLVEKETADGTKVEVKEQVGSYSLAELESEKSQLENQLAEVENKINAINEIK
jgi:ABC-type phosphate transport system auxiliary subunit